MRYAMGQHKAAVNSSHLFFVRFYKKKQSAYFINLERRLQFRQQPGGQSDIV